MVDERNSVDTPLGSISEQYIYLFFLEFGYKVIFTGKSNIKGLYLLWNKVPSRERNELQRLCEQFVSVLGIPVMETVLPDSTKFRKEGQGEKRFSVFRSTILPPDKSSLKGSGIEEMAAEIMGIIGI